MAGEFEHLAEVAPLKAGELLVLTDGEYSEYGIVLIGRVLVDLDLGALARAYFERFPERRGDYASNSAFIAAMLLDKLDLLDWREANLSARLVVYANSGAAKAKRLPIEADSDLATEELARLARGLSDKASRPFSDAWDAVNADPANAELVARRNRIYRYDTERGRA